MPYTKDLVLLSEVSKKLHLIIRPFLYAKVVISVLEHHLDQVTISPMKTYFKEDGSRDTFNSLEFLKDVQLQRPHRRPIPCIKVKSLMSRKPCARSRGRFAVHGVRLPSWHGYNEFPDKAANSCPRLAASPLGVARILAMLRLKTWLKTVWQMRFCCELECNPYAG